MYHHNNNGAIRSLIKIKVRRGKIKSNLGMNELIVTFTSVINCGGGLEGRLYI